MTNAKIEKIDAAIAKGKEIISAQQAKLRELEHQRKIEEDTVIVALFRSENLTLDDIAAFMRMKADAAHTELAKEENTDDEE